MFSWLRQLISFPKAWIEIEWETDYYQGGMKKHYYVWYLKNLTDIPHLAHSTTNEQLAKRALKELKEDLGVR